MADSEGIVKYGLANGKHGQCRLPLPPGGSKVRQISATPRHLLVVTENGGNFFCLTEAICMKRLAPFLTIMLISQQISECWAHEESKGWRFVNVNAEVTDGISKDASLENNDPKLTCNNSAEEPDILNSYNNGDKAEQISVKDTNLINLNEGSDEIENKDDLLNSKDKESCNLKNQHNILSTKNVTNTVLMVKTSCGDAHNIGLDENGKAYSLPSPLDFNPFPNGSTHKVRPRSSIFIK